jgi:hypothetical protein
LVKNERTGLAYQTLGLAGLDDPFVQIATTARAEPVLHRSVAMRLMVLLVV